MGSKYFTSNCEVKKIKILGFCLKKQKPNTFINTCKQYLLVTTYMLIYKSKLSLSHR